MAQNIRATCKFSNFSKLFKQIDAAVDTLFYVLHYFLTPLENFRLVVVSSYGPLYKPDVLTYFPSRLHLENFLATVGSVSLSLSRLITH